MEHQKTDTERIDFAQARRLDLNAIKDLVERMGADENIDDMKDGIQLVLQAKDRFMAVVCRVFGWDDWQDSGSRSAPDRVVDQAIALIQSNPELFM